MHYLVLYRIYQVLTLSYDKLGRFLVRPQWPESIEEMALSGELILQYELQGGHILRIKERYQVKRYALQINYMYMLSAAEGSPIFSCDNAPHHPEVGTFPHHKHRYPKAQFPSTEFSGEIAAFLDDVLWELSR